MHKVLWEIVLTHVTDIDGMDVLMCLWLVSGYVWGAFLLSITLCVSCIVSLSCRVYRFRARHALFNYTERWVVLVGLCVSIQMGSSVCALNSDRISSFCFVCCVCVASTLLRDTHNFCSTHPWRAKVLHLTHRKPVDFLLNSPEQPT